VSQQRRNKTGDAEIGIGEGCGWVKEIAGGRRLIDMYPYFTYKLHIGIHARTGN